ncbi:MAG: hypothetical protein ACE5R4_11865 [Armatimonadota bacterium]
MLHVLRAAKRARVYGAMALLGAFALAAWLGYLLWTGRWAELDPVYATSAVILLWVYTLLDARATVSALRDEIELLHGRQTQRVQEIRSKAGSDRWLVDRHGPR